MKKIIVASSVVGAFLLGAVSATLAVRDAHAGTTAAGTECFAVTLWSVPGKSFNSGTQPNTVKIPAGWEVVGGAGTQPAAIVCRK